MDLKESGWKGLRQTPTFNLAHIELFGRYRKAIVEQEEARREYRHARTPTTKHAATLRFRLAGRRVCALRTLIESTLRDEARSS